jgi:hypothetical protein
MAKTASENASTHLSAPPKFAVYKIIDYRKSKYAN